MRRCYGCMREVETATCPGCGWTRERDNEFHQLPVGTVLMGKYTVGRTLGQGGFGITYLGWDTEKERTVAIKEFYPGSLVNRENTQSLSVKINSRSMEGSFASGRDRFLREARALAKLKEVPQIVGIHESFPENGTAYIVMEYIRGLELRKYVDMKGGRLDQEECFRILEPILRALETVHAEGLVHRDISPDNIMLDPMGGAKLLDFGAVRTVEHPDAEKDMTHSTETIVKHGFAPMEQYRDRGSLGPWTDEYALCATVYYCLTGRIPPDAMARAMEDEDLDWSAIPDLLPRRRKALEKGMSVKAKDRFPDMKSLREALYGKDRPAPKPEENKEEKPPVREAPKKERPPKEEKPRTVRPPNAEEPEKVRPPKEKPEKVLPPKAERPKKERPEKALRPIPWKPILITAAVLALIGAAMLIPRKAPAVIPEGPTAQMAAEPSGPAQETTGPEASGPSGEGPQETAPVPGEGEATLLSTGELLMHMPIVDSCKTDGSYDFSPIFRYVAPYVMDADLAAATLSTTFCGTENGYGYGGYPAFNSPDELAADVRDSGFDMQVTATKHAWSTGWDGFSRTYDTVWAAGMEPVGTRTDVEDPDFAVRDVGGIRVGMLAYTQAFGVDAAGDPILNGIDSLSSPDILDFFTADKLDLFAAEIADRCAIFSELGVDVTVVYIYWLEEYAMGPSAVQREVAQILCDLGVDVIVGSGTHTVQPMELLESNTDPEHRTICAYSLGNAVSNQRQGTLPQISTAHTEDGALFSVSFAKDGDGDAYVSDVELIPCWLDLRNDSDRRAYAILPLDPDTRSSWKNDFSLTDAGLADAEASYDRTMDTVTPGLTDIRTWLDAAVPTDFQGAGLLMSDPLSALSVDKLDITSVRFLETMDRSYIRDYFLETGYSTGELPEPTDLSADGDGSVLGYFDGGLLVICAENGVDGSVACPGLFAGCERLETVSFGGAFHTENATSMEDMFLICRCLRSVDVENLDTSNVTTMRGMFDMARNDEDFSYYTNANEVLTALDVSGWDVSKVEDMSGMFVGCKVLQDLDVSGWDVGNVRNMKSLFQGCEKLRALAVGDWDVSKVTSMEATFHGCYALKELDVSKWDTGNVTTMKSMFDMLEWHEDYMLIVHYEDGLTALDVSGWDVSNVSDMSYMFSNCLYLEELDVSGWDVSNVTTMLDMFSNCGSLKTLAVGNWDVGNVTNMCVMFSGCVSLESLDVSGWDVSNVRAMWDMFSYCESLVILDVSNWNVSNVEVLTCAFKQMTSLEYLDVSRWDVSNVYYMREMFSGCSPYILIDGVRNWEINEGIKEYDSFAPEGLYIDDQPWEYWFRNV